MEIVEAFIPGNRLPGAAAEICPGIAGRLTVLTLAEVEIVAILAIGIFQSLLEPFVLVRAVVDDQIHNNMHVPLLCLGQQFVELLHGTKGRVNIVIVRNVVALIHKRRAVNGRNPNNVDA